MYYYPYEPLMRDLTVASDPRLIAKDKCDPILGGLTDKSVIKEGSF